MRRSLEELAYKSSHLWPYPVFRTSACEGRFVSYWARENGKKLIRGSFQGFKIGNKLGNKTCQKPLKTVSRLKG